MIAFNLDDANEICEDFEDLKDTEFTIGTRTVYLVENVVVCPFPEEDRLAFIENYIASKDAARSLSMYNGSEYDILLFACDVENEKDLVHLTIRTYADQQGIGYSFPVQ